MCTGLDKCINHKFFVKLLEFSEKLRAKYVELIITYLKRSLDLINELEYLYLRFNFKHY